LDEQIGAIKHKVSTNNKRETKKEIIKNRSDKGDF
jgi:hypothetical protein